jgi:3'(2'), 5'-bisphosphate nucleotidase
LGVVYIPAKDDLYYGGERIGAYFNNKAIQARQNPDFGALHVIASKDSPVKDKRDAYLTKHNLEIGTFVMRGSSLKFCLVADGQADLYPRFVPTYEWDTAAAHALLLQTGGDIIDADTKKRLTYGKHEKRFKNGFLITATNPVLGRLGLS